VEKEKMQKNEEMAGALNVAGAADELGMESPLISTVAEPPPGTEDVQGIEPLRKNDGEGDVKMEDT
jgi:hypothetical protein